MHYACRMGVRRAAAAAASALQVPYLKAALFGSDLVPLPLPLVFRI